MTATHPAARQASAAQRPADAPFLIAASARVYCATGLFL
ncbi:hypothetical protein [Polaromonas sp. CG9_12]|nr:hypothetical protein [Polaromonas sp. CG9_12]